MTDLLLEIVFLLVVTAAFLGALIGVGEYIRIKEQLHKQNSHCTFYAASKHVVDKG